MRLVGIPDADAQEEAIHLGFRQWVRPVVFERILRGQHHERLGQPIGVVVQRHLALVHRLQ
jgi:hypothetical protein